MEEFTIHGIDTSRDPQKKEHLPISGIGQRIEGGSVSLTGSRARAKNCQFPRMVDILCMENTGNFQSSVDALTGNDWHKYAVLRVD